MRRIGVLYSGAREYTAQLWGVFVDQLRQMGWAEDDNLSIEWRFADGRDEVLPQLAADLVGLPAEVIFTASTNAAVAAKQQTSTISIVMIGATDPVAAGLVSSLGHPGGNVTGTTYGGATTGLKSVELFKTVLPRLSRLSILDDQSYPARGSMLPPVIQAASRLGVQTQDLDVRRVEDVDSAVEAARSWSADGLLIVTQPNFQAGVYARIAELTAQAQLPALFESSTPVAENGGLMGFGPDIPTEFRQGAEYVDKILRGASPADLPVEDPRQWDFVVNVKTAQALGITFPPDAAAQVTQWVQ
jgi:putative ABC transport system substrate-binding protein